MLRKNASSPVVQEWGEDTSNIDNNKIITQSLKMLYKIGSQTISS